MNDQSLRTTIKLAQKDIHYIKEGISRIETALEKHMQEDKQEFISIRKDITSMNKYGATIAVLAGGVGYLWKRFIG